MKILCVHKACWNKNIPLKIIKINRESLSFFICQLQNYCIKRGEFPNDFKHAYVLPVYEKNEMNMTNNHRPLNIFSNMLKVFKGHSNGHSSQYSALNMTVDSKKSITRVTHLPLVWLIFQKLLIPLIKIFWLLKSLYSEFYLCH